jgi:hypothetical protein
VRDRSIRSRHLFCTADTGALTVVRAHVSREVARDRPRFISPSGLGSATGQVC